MRSIIILKLVVAFIGVTNYSVAQHISGKIIDKETKEPLIGANIFLKSNWRSGTSSDLNGEFNISLSNTTIDTLIVSYIGYNEKEIAFNSADESELTINLQSDAQNLDEIVVKAEKLIAEEFTYRKLERLDVYLNPSAKADPLLAVNALPSSTTLDESANISFRGSSPAETGIFFNNVPIYDAVRFSQLSGIGTFSIFNTAIVNHLQVFPGNPPLEYGNTTSGLVAIQTVEDVPKMATNSATISIASFGLLTSRPLSKKTGLTVFTNYQPSELLTSINSEALDAIDKFQSNDLGINLTHKINDQSILKVFNYSLYENYKYKFESPTFNGIFNQSKKRNFTVINYRRNFENGQLTINGNQSFSKADFSYSDTDILIRNRDTFIGINHQIMSDIFDLKTGVNYDFRHQQYTGTSYEFSYAVGDGYPTMYGESKENLHRPEIFTYGKLYVGKKWILGGGLRKNIPINKQKNYLSGQFNLRFELSEDLAINTGWGKYNKYNLPQNDNENSTLLTSEQLTLDLLYENKPLSFNLSVFHKNNSQRQLKTKIIGAEAFAKTTLFKKLTAQASFTFIDANTSDELENKDYPSTYDINYFIKGSLKYDYNQYWSATVNFNFREGNYFQPFTNASYDASLQVYEPQYTSQSDQERLPEYNIIDLSVSRIILINEKINIIAFGSISNLLNTKNVRNYNYNFDYTEQKKALFSQRTVYFGAIINF